MDCNSCYRRNNCEKKEEIQKIADNVDQKISFQKKGYPFFEIEIKTTCKDCILELSALTQCCCFAEKY